MVGLVSTRRTVFVSASIASDQEPYLAYQPAHLSISVRRERVSQKMGDMRYQDGINNTRCHLKMRLYSSSSVFVAVTHLDILRSILGGAGPKRVKGWSEDYVQ